MTTQFGKMTKNIEMAQTLTNILELNWLDKPSESDVQPLLTYLVNHSELYLKSLLDLHSLVATRLADTVADGNTQYKAFFPHKPDAYLFIGSNIEDEDLVLNHLIAIGEAKKTGNIDVPRLEILCKAIVSPLFAYLGIYIVVTRLELEIGLFSPLYHQPPSSLSSPSSSPSLPSLSSPSPSPPSVFSPSSSSSSPQAIVHFKRWTLQLPLSVGILSEITNYLELLLQLLSNIYKTASKSTTLKELVNTDDNGELGTYLCSVLNLTLPRQFTCNVDSQDSADLLEAVNIYREVFCELVVSSPKSPPLSPPLSPKSSPSPSSPQVSLSSPSPSSPSSPSSPQDDNDNDNDTSSSSSITYKSHIFKRTYCPEAALYHNISEFKKARRVVGVETVYLVGPLIQYEAAATYYCTIISLDCDPNKVFENLATSCNEHLLNNKSTFVQIGATIKQLHSNYFAHCDIHSHNLVAFGDQVVIVDIEYCIPLPPRNETLAKTWLNLKTCKRFASFLQVALAYFKSEFKLIKGRIIVAIEMVIDFMSTGNNNLTPLLAYIKTLDLANYTPDKRLNALNYSPLCDSPLKARFDSFWRDADIIYSKLHTFNKFFHFSSQESLIALDFYSFIVIWFPFVLDTVAAANDEFVGTVATLLLALVNNDPSFDKLYDELLHLKPVPK